MPIHLQKEIDKLKKMLLSLCDAVEDALQRAVKSIKERNADLARKVIEEDINIDHMEVNMEEEILKILALYQPVAIDLRFIITTLKINNDLERIGDLAVNIAERSEFLADKKDVQIPADFEEMAEKTQSMLTESLDTLVNIDSLLARKVCAEDDEVDALNRRMFLIVQNEIRKHPEQMEALIHVLSASRHLERIADHVTNIAEDIIYMIEGQIVRHKPEAYKS
jgi:phosphate transport system protein